MLAAINQSALPVLRIVAVFFFALNIAAAFVFIVRNRHRFFDRDPNVDGDEIASARRLRVEVIFIPWIFLTICLLCLLIGFWMA